MHISLWRWVEHVLAMAGFAWLALWIIEALSAFIGRQREIARIDADIQKILKRVWDEQRTLQRQEKTSASHEAKKLAAQLPELKRSEADGTSEVESLKRRLEVVQWATEAAWVIARDPRYGEELTAIYTRAGRECVLHGGSITTADIQQIVQSVAHREGRPKEFERTVLYDLAALYLEAAQLDASRAAVAAVVPMILEEYFKTPQATGQELLARWKIRVDSEMDRYRPGRQTGAS